MYLHKSEMTSPKLLNLQSLNRKLRLTPEPTKLALMGNLVFSVQWVQWHIVRIIWGWKTNVCCTIAFHSPLYSCLLSLNGEWQWLKFRAIALITTNWIQNSTFSGRIFSFLFQVEMLARFWVDFVICSFSISLFKGLPMASHHHSHFPQCYPSDYLGAAVIKSKAPGY